MNGAYGGAAVIYSLKKDYKKNDREMFSFSFLALLLFLRI
jgi:hypothetical protein